MLKYIIIILIIILLVPFIWGIFSGFSKAKISVNELMQIAYCKLIYAYCDGYYQSNGMFPTSLSVVPYLQKDLVKWKKYGYKYNYEKTGSGFYITASPVVMNKTGRFYFHIDETKKVLVCNKNRYCMTENEYLNARNQINYSDLSQR